MEHVITALHNGENASSHEAEAVIRPKLDPDEKLLWSGKPKQGAMLRKGDALMIPFSLMWGGFAIFWEIGVLYMGAPLLFKLWGIPFVMVGLYMIFGRFYADSHRRERTFYGLTNKRIIIVAGIFGRQVKYVSLDRLDCISIEEHADGRGTITFGAELPQWWARRGWGECWMGVPYIPCFELVENANEIYRMARDAGKRK